MLGLHVLLAIFSTMQSSQFDRISESLGKKTQVLRNGEVCVSVVHPQKVDFPYTFHCCLRFNTWNMDNYYTRIIFVLHYIIIINGSSNPYQTYGCYLFDDFPSL